MSEASATPDDPAVSDNPGEHRFEISVGGAVAGFAAYHDNGGRRTFTHTEVDSAYEGRGLGSTLVRAVLDDARAGGRDVLPVCPFVREWLQRHPDYVALVPAADRERFDLPAADD